MRTIRVRKSARGKVAPALLVAFALGVAACGSDDGDEGSATTEGGTATPSSDATSAPGSTSPERPAEGEPVSGGELTVLHVSSPASLDPVSGGSGHDHLSLYPLYDRLVNFEPTTLEAQPGLATSWDQPDPQTLVLTLAEGVTFHDGTPFDAEAVKYNLERSLTLDTSTVKADIAMIESVEVTGPLEVTIHLNRPDASLVLILADRAGMMVSPTAAEELGAELGRKPVGTGPFTFVEFVDGDRLVLAKNAEYWQDGKPYLDELTVRYLSDAQAASNAIQTGQVDVALKMRPEQIEVPIDGVEFVVNPSLGTDLCYFNFSRAPFDDPDVRQAAMLAVDREALNQAHTLGLGEPATEVFPPGYWAADPSRVDAITYDPEAARELLAAAGHADGVDIRGLTYNGPGQAMKAEIIQAQLAEVGIDMSIETMEVGTATSTFFENLSYDLYCASWSGRPDPSQTANSLFAADTFYNAGNYDAPGMSDALEAAGASADHDERAAAFAEIVRISQDDALLLPLVHQPDITAVHEGVGGFVPNLYGKPDISFLWQER
jgi:peptide/nickel transport system permease protein/peptide/nickel transport system substrate-binding protein